MNFPKARPWVLVLALIAWESRPAAAQERSESPQSEIPWTNDLQQALSDSAKDRKPVIVCLVAAWCYACRDFETGALKSPQILEHADRFHWVKLDVDRNVSLVRTFNLKGTPRTDFISPDGSTRIQISGAMPPKDLGRQLATFLSEVAREPGAPPGPGIREIKAQELTELAETPEGFRSLSMCYSNVGYGPLRLSSQSPFQSLRIGLSPLTPSTLAEGQWEFHLSNAYSNVFIKKTGEYLLQFDLMQSNASASYGITNDLEVDLGFDDRSRFGGFMDQFIQHFHRAFGLAQQDRKTEPLNAFAIQFPASQSHPAVDLGNRWRGNFSDTVSVALRENLTCGTEETPAVAVGLLLRTAPGGSEDLEHEEVVDPGLTLSAAKRVGDFYFYASGLVAYYGRERFHGIPLRPVQLSGLLAVEWRFDNWASMVFQYQINEGVTEDLGPFNSPASELALGWKIEFLQNALVEFGAIHTILNNENSVDFGFYAGLTVRF